jgi:hypothetical protein
MATTNEEDIPVTINVTTNDMLTNHVASRFGPIPTAGVQTHGSTVAGEGTAT